LVQVVITGIAAISLFVGGVGIMNTMYTAVTERRRDIGIMKAVGAKNSHILSLFLIESGLVGIVGGALGIILGLSISRFVQFIAEYYGVLSLKASFSLFLILGALAFSFIIGVVSGITPAMQASKLQPVEALRKK
jgi:putative ABC transport system permease protein